MDSNKPVLVRMEAQYMQDSDGMSHSDAENQITIKAENAGVGFYYVIQTERWAFDDPKELIDLLESFRSNVEANTTEV